MCVRNSDRKGRRSIRARRQRQLRRRPDRPLRAIQPTRLGFRWGTRGFAPSEDTSTPPRVSNSPKKEPRSVRRGPGGRESALLAVRSEQQLRQVEAGPLDLAGLQVEDAHDLAVQSDGVLVLELRVRAPGRAGLDGRSRLSFPNGDGPDERESKIPPGPSLSLTHRRTSAGVEPTTWPSRLPSRSACRPLPERAARPASRQDRAAGRRSERPASRPASASCPAGRR